jgi:hypothetical protein
MQSVRSVVCLTGICLVLAGLLVTHVRQASAIPALPGVIDAASIDEFDCTNYCEECELPSGIAGTKAYRSRDPVGGYRRVVEWSCVDVPCPMKSNDCPGGDALVRVSADGLRELWDLAKVGGPEEIKRATEIPGVELNVERHALQAIGCGGNVVASVPLSIAQVAALAD